MAPALGKRSLLIDSEWGGGLLARQARQTESQHELARSRLAAAVRLAAPRAAGSAPEETPSDADAAEPGLVERSAPGGACPVGRRPRLEELLSPFTVEGFFRAQNSRSHAVLLRGGAVRFEHFAHWRDLDSLVTAGNLDAGKVRMVFNGAELSPTLYSVTLPGTFGSLSERFSGTVDGRKVRSLAAAGATLILDDADLHLDTVAAVAEAFETALATRSRVNLYASWRSMRGFDTHWDYHDVFVLQVKGEKIWRVLGPTRACPTREDSALSEVPPESPLWSGRLTAGDLLYIPRGWWHDAHVPADGDGRGSIHLTCRVSELNGSNVLECLARSLQPDMSFRRPIPVWAGEKALADYIAGMKVLIRTALDRLDTESVAGQLRSRWAERSAPGLGAWVEPWKDPRWRRYRLRLLGRAHANCENEGESVRLFANGWTHTVDSRARTVIDALLEREEVAVEALKQAGEKGGAAPDAIDKLLIRWIQRGVLHAAAPPEKAAGE